MTKRRYWITMFGINCIIAESWCWKEKPDGPIVWFGRVGSNPNLKNFVIGPFLFSKLAKRNQND
jgi:hypothetical protein